MVTSALRLRYLFSHPSQLVLADGIRPCRFSMAYAGTNQGNIIRYRRSIWHTKRGVRCSSTISCSGVITTPSVLAPLARDASRVAKSWKNVGPVLGLVAHSLFLACLKPFDLMTRKGFDIRKERDGFVVSRSFLLFADKLMLVARPNLIGESAGRVCVFNVHAEPTIAHRGHVER